MDYSAVNAMMMMMMMTYIALYFMLTGEHRTPEEPSDGALNKCHYYYN